MTEPIVPLADVIYAHGKAVSEGLITRDEAVAYLAANYELTRLGAADVLRNWRTIHELYGGSS